MVCALACPECLAVYSLPSFLFPCVRALFAVDSRIVCPTTPTCLVTFPCVLLFRLALYIHWCVGFVPGRFFFVQVRGAAAWAARLAGSILPRVMFSIFYAVRPLVRK